MSLKHGQWIYNTLKRQFFPERECYRLITGEDVKFLVKIKGDKGK